LDRTLNIARIAAAIQPWIAACNLMEEIAAVSVLLWRLLT
jgi:hypothetical protein